MPQKAIFQKKPSFEIERLSHAISLVILPLSLFVFLVTILAALGLASGQIGYENVSVAEFSKIIKQKDVQILDVRTQEEYDSGHIKGALLADYKGSSFLV